MTDPTRQEILVRLERLSALAPDMRFGQLIANLAFMATERPWDQALWDLEDESLLTAIRQFESDLSRRPADGSCSPLQPTGPTGTASLTPPAAD